MGPHLCGRGKDGNKKRKEKNSGPLRDNYRRLYK